MSFPSGSSGVSAQRVAPGTLVANRRAERLVPVAEDPSGHLDRVADGALDRVAAAVDLRRDLLDLDPRGIRLRDRHARSLTDEEGSKRGALSLGRHPPPSDVASVRKAGPGRVPVRRLARRGRAVVVAGAAARAAGRVRARRTARRLRSPPRPSSSPGPTRGSRPARSRTSSRAIRTGPAAGRASPARTRSPTRCGSSGSGERCGTTRRRAAIRLIGDLPIYVSDEGADLAGWPELFARGEVAGAPPDALSASGQRWGNPLYDWPVAPRDRLSLVARALPAHVRARRPLPGRPLPRLRLLLGDSGAEHDREARTLAARARAPSSSARSSASSATCR